MAEDKIGAAVAIANLLADHQKGYGDTADAIDEYTSMFGDSVTARWLHDLVSAYIGSTGVGK